MIGKSVGQQASSPAIEAASGRERGITFARSGANVVIAGRREERLRQIGIFINPRTRSNIEVQDPY